MSIVTVDELRQHLRMETEYEQTDETDAENAYLESLIARAQSAAEDFCLRAFGDDEPASVKLAVILLASHYYEIRDNYDKQSYLSVKMAFESLLWPHRDLDKLV